MKIRYTALLLSLFLFSACDEEENPETTPTAPTVEITANGITFVDGQAQISVMQDSSVTLGYTVTAPGGISEVAYTIGSGEKVTLTDVGGEESYSGEIVVVVPHESQRIELLLEVVDNYEQVGRQDVALEVEAIEPPEVVEEGVVFFEDFEGTLKAGSTLVRGVAVVENKPYAGKKSARANLMNGATDPFIEKTASNQTYEYSGQVLVENELPVVTVEWYFRFDDADWAGSLFGEKNEPSDVDLKGGYFGWANDKVNGFYTGFRGGAAGEIRWADNRGRGDDGWENSEWAVKGRIAFYLQTGKEWGAGTGWHKFTIKVDYSHADYNQVKLYVDDIVAKNGSYASNGIIRVPKTWKLEQFSTSYTGDGNTNQSVDRTETACGLQFDNVKIRVGDEF